jgi:hypothetical protein
MLHVSDRAAVLQVVTTENVGTFTIVDLAGSERVKKSGASGQTMNEAQVGHLALPRWHLHD